MATANWSMVTQYATTGSDTHTAISAGGTTLTAFADPGEEVPTLGETALYVDCVEDPAQDACEGLPAVVAESPGYLWFGEQCDDLALEFPESHMAYAYEVPFEEETVCAMHLGNGPPYHICLGCPESKPKLPCQSEQEASDGAAPLSKECEGGQEALATSCR